MLSFLKILQTKYNNIHSLFYLKLNECLIKKCPPSVLFPQFFRPHIFLQGRMFYQNPPTESTFIWDAPLAVVQTPLYTGLCFPPLFLYFLSPFWNESPVGLGRYNAECMHLLFWSKERETWYEEVSWIEPEKRSKQK